MRDVGILKTRLVAPVVIGRELLEGAEVGGEKAASLPIQVIDPAYASLPADWTMADIERLCRSHGLTATAPLRGSHYKIRHSSSAAVLTIPARRPIKPVYIRALVALVDLVVQQKEGP